MSQYPIIKECFKCSQKKPLSEFYRHKAMSDGYLNKCKKCTKKDVHTHRVGNIEKIREYDRNRPNSKERNKKHLARMAKIKKENPLKYKKLKSTASKWIKKNRHKSIAHQQARREAMKNNSKPNNCQLCGVKINTLDGHHYDYDKPKEVTWLCKRCHGLAHKAINEDKRSSA